MRIASISVTSAATVPTVQFGNVRPSLELSAEVHSGEDAAACVRELQDIADTLLLAHIERLAAKLKELTA
jgi:hypothetical protein